MPSSDLYYALPPRYRDAPTRLLRFSWKRTGPPAPSSAKGGPPVPAGPGKREASTSCFSGLPFEQKLLFSCLRFGRVEKTIVASRRYQGFVLFERPEDAARCKDACLREMAGLELDEASAADAASGTLRAPTFREIVGVGMPLACEGYGYSPAALFSSPLRSTEGGGADGKEEGESRQVDDEKEFLSVMHNCAFELSPVLPCSQAGETPAEAVEQWSSSASTPTGEAGSAASSEKLPLVIKKQDSLVLIPAIQGPAEPYFTLDKFSECPSASCCYWDGSGAEDESAVSSSSSSSSRRRTVFVNTPFPPEAKTFLFSAPAAAASTGSDVAGLSEPQLLPEGLMVIHDFITHEEEKQLLAYLYRADKTAAENGDGGGEGEGEGKSRLDEDPWNGNSESIVRRVQHYGNGFDYVSRTTVGPNTNMDSSAASASSSAPACSVPPIKVQPLESSTPLHRLVVERIARYGFIGNEGNTKFNSFTSNSPLMGRKDLLKWMSDHDALPGPKPTPGPGSGPSSAHGDDELDEDALLPVSAPFPFPLSNQVTVNEYRQGQGIAGHVDTHEGFDDGIVSLSMGDGPVVMELHWAAKEPKSALRSSLAAAVDPTTQEAREKAKEKVVVTSVLPAGEGPACHEHPKDHDGDEKDDDEEEGPAFYSPSGARLYQHSHKGSGSSSVYSTAGTSNKGGIPPPVYLVLPPRSLLCLRGEARYAWSHSIPARKSDFIDGKLRPRPNKRVSITCRVVRPEGQDCVCRWPSLCRSQAVKASELFSPHLKKRVAAELAEDPKKKDDVSHDSKQQPVSDLSSGLGSAAEHDVLRTPALESQHVHRLYNAIAPHFSATRHSPWPKVEAFLRSLPSGSVVCDAGCGNGKYCRVRSGFSPSSLSADDLGLFFLGSDRSEGLVSFAAHDDPSSLAVAPPRREALVADALCLPLRDRCSDAAISIAVLHHISTPQRRVRLIQELLRVVKPSSTSQGSSGLIFIQAWALEQGSDSRRGFEKGKEMRAKPLLAQEGQEAERRKEPPQDGEGDDQAEGAARGDRGAAARAQGRDVLVPWNLSASFLGGAAAEEPKKSKAHKASGKGKKGAMMDQEQQLGKTEEVPAVASAAPLVIPKELEDAGGVFDPSKKAVVFERYCHMYAKGELESLIKVASSGAWDDGHRSATLIYSRQVANFLGLKDSEEKVVDDANDDAAISKAAGAASSVAVMVESFWDKDNWCSIVKKWR